MSMMISRSNAVSATALSGITSNVTGNKSFEETQITENAPAPAPANPNTDWVASDPCAPVSGNGSTWVAVAPGVEEGTMPDGTKIEYCNIDYVLTPEDKELVGWPCDDDPQMLAVAGMIAEDRACGDLTGPINSDYILGNESKHISGLADRLPGLSEDTIKTLALNLFKQNL